MTSDELRHQVAAERFSNGSEESQGAEGGWVLPRRKKKKAPPASLFRDEADAPGSKFGSAALFRDEADEADASDGDPPASPSTAPLPNLDPSDPFGRFSSRPEGAVVGATVGGGEGGGGGGESGGGGGGGEGDGGSAVSGATTAGSAGTRAVSGAPLGGRPRSLGDRLGDRLASAQYGASAQHGAGAPSYKPAPSTARVPASFTEREAYKQELLNKTRLCRHWTTMGSCYHGAQV